jgi:hypothetical protein
VLNRCVNNALAGLLFTFSLPFLVFGAVLAGLESRSPAILRRLRSFRKGGRLAFLKPQCAEEFGFERAIEAYEELIDSTLADRQA